MLVLLLILLYMNIEHIDWNDRQHQRFEIESIQAISISKRRIDNVPFCIFFDRYWWIGIELLMMAVCSLYREDQRTGSQDYNLADGEPKSNGYIIERTHSWNQIR